MTKREILRLSLIRFATSFLVILIIGILNRIMIAELQINKVLVVTILSFQHLVTPIALYFGFLSDQQPVRRRRRAPYILFGMALCCLPIPFLPDIAQQMSLGNNYIFFIAVSILSLVLFGVGVAISSIALHALIVDRCPPNQRGEALTTVWIITLVGFIIAVPIFALLLPEYDSAADHERFRIVFAVTAIAAMSLTVFGVRKQERKEATGDKIAGGQRISFFRIFKSLAANPHARLLFAFLAMADFFFFMQEYVLEAFGQEVFKLSVAYTTSFNLYWGIGILISMVGLNALLNLLPKLKEKRLLAIGAIVSSASFLMLALSSFGAVEAIILIAVFTMGFGKGIFNVGLARLMVRVARPDLSGLIMGLWAVVGGVAIGLGELGGGVIIDLGLRITGNTPTSYGILFMLEAVGLLLCLSLMSMLNVRLFHAHLQERWPAPHGRPQDAVSF